MVWAAPGFNGLILLSELIWFSVKWAEVSIGLVWFFFHNGVGLVRIEILFSSLFVASEGSFWPISAAG